MATVNEDINPQRLGHVLDDDMCRRALNRAHKKVVAEMDPDVVLNELRNSGFLPQGEYEDLMNLITLPMKIPLLVNKISQGGIGAYFEFKKCLRATNHEQLVIELELKEAEIISEMTRYTELRNERSSRRNNEFTLYERMETDEQPLQRSALYGTRREQEFVQTITKDPHNGGLIELTKEMLEELKSPGVSEQGHRGGFDTVYISQMDTGIQFTYPAECFPRYDYFKRRVKDYVERLKRILDASGCVDCIPDASQLLEEILQKTKHVHDEVNIYVFRDCVDVCIPEIAVNTTLRNIGHKKDNETTFIWTKPEFIAIFPKSAQGESPVVAREMPMERFRETKKDSVSPVCSVVVLIVSTDQGRVIDIFETIGVLMEKYVLRVGKTPTCSLEEVVAQSTRRIFVKHNLEEITKSIEKHVASFETRVELFKHNVLTAVKKQTRCTLVEILSDKHGIQQTVVLSLLGEGHFELDEKLSDIHWTINTPSQIHIDKQIRFRWFDTNTYAENLQFNSTKLIADSDEYIRLKVSFFEKMKKLEFELHGILQMTEVPITTVIPKIPSISSELREEILRIEDVRGCGHVYGRLLIIVNHLQESNKKRIQWLLRTYKYFHGYTIREMALVVQAASNIRNGHHLQMRNKKVSRLELQEFESSWKILEKVMINLGTSCGLNDIMDTIATIKTKTLAIVTPEMRRLREYQDDKQYNVETKFWNQAQQMLKNLKVLTGHPGGGKTAMAVYLALKRSRPENCIKLADAGDWRKVDWSLKLFNTVIICAIFGDRALNTAYLADWKTYLPEIERAAKANLINVIITSRHYIKGEALDDLNNICIFIDKEGNITQLASNYFTSQEKRDILLSCIKRTSTEDLFVQNHVDIDECISRSTGTMNLNKTGNVIFGFPQCACLFVQSVKMIKLGAQFFENPEINVKAYIEQVYTAKDEELFRKCIALVIVWAEQTDRIKADHVRNASKSSDHIRVVANTFGIAVNRRFMENISSSLQSHQKKFLVYVDHSREYKFSHYGVGDMVGVVLGYTRHKLAETIELCPRDFLMNRICLDDAGNKQFRVVVGNDSYHHLCKKIAKKIMRIDCNSDGHGDFISEIQQ